MPVTGCGKASALISCGDSKVAAKWLAKWLARPAPDRARSVPLRAGYLISMAECQQAGIRQSQRSWSILLQTVPGASRSVCRISHLHGGMPTGGTPVGQDSRDGYPPPQIIQIPENNPCNGKKNRLSAHVCKLEFSTAFHSSPAPALAQSAN